MVVLRNLLSKRGIMMPGIAFGGVVAGALLGLVMAGPPDPQRIDVPDPCAGCSAEQREVWMANAVEQLNRSRDQLAAEFKGNGVDPRSLPRVSWMREYLTGYSREYSSVYDAARGVDAVLEVEVTDATFLPGMRVLTTARVLETIKGNGEGVIQFVQDGGLMKDPETGSLHLVEAEVFPLLLAGDRAILLLERVGADLKIIPAYGWLKESGATVTPPGIFLGSRRVVAAGTTVAEAKARLRQALAAVARWSPLAAGWAAHHRQALERREARLRRKLQLPYQ